MATNSVGDFLIAEPKGHPYGVSATFSKVQAKPQERPHQTLQRCIEEQVGEAPLGICPIPVVWSTPNSQGMYAE